MCIGRFDLNKYVMECGNCSWVIEPMSNVEFLVRNGYWPGNLSSSSSAYIFHQELFHMWDIFKKKWQGHLRKVFRGIRGIFIEQRKGMLYVM